MKMPVSRGKRMTNNELMEWLFSQKGEWFSEDSLPILGKSEAGNLPVRDGVLIKPNGWSSWVQPTKDLI